MSVPHDASQDALREALRNLQRGDARSAGEMAQRALLGAPDDAGWIGIRAVALSAQGQAGEALPLYQRLVALQPQQATHWSNLGNCLCELGRALEAREPLERALALGARDAAVHFAMARALAAAGELRPALAHAEQALARDPGDFEFRLLRAQLLGGLDEWNAAHGEVDALLRQPLDAAQRCELGYLLSRGGSHDAAERVFAEVLRDDPGQTDARIGAVLALERLNRLDAALRERATLESQLDASARERLSDKLLQLDARLAGRQNDPAAARAKLEALLSRPDLDITTRISFGFDLGAALAKTGDVDGAMKAFAEAHALRFAQATALHPALALRSDLYGVMDEPLPDPAPPALRFADERRDPVFVVGFPRSGTTLLEQLLDAHSELASFDEQPFVQGLAQGLYTRADTIQAALRTLDASSRQQLRERYFADVDGVLPAPLGVGARPVDKNPLNLLRLPLLPHFFPDARVILAVRHPCDVVLSCYMQHFGSPAFAVVFDTLESCAELYDRVFDYWLRTRDAIGLPLHVLRYEDLVASTEAEARRLMAFLDLPWQDDLLRFTQRARERAIGTPSYAQVVEPVNPKAVGRWLAYRRHFSERTLERLRPWIERFGYEAI
ncbi:tetratricopeptide repeat-containing sulfotransferase family protein [Lysobacter terrae]